MKPLLILPNSYRADDNDMYRTAIRLGWSVERTTNEPAKIEELFTANAAREIYYYGNMLHAERAGIGQFINFLPIDPTFLARLPRFTKRKIELLKAKDLKQPLEEDCFLKPPSEKWFEARVYKKGTSISVPPKDDDLLYKQEIVSFVDEVRVFTLDGMAQTSSYYRLKTVRWDETNEGPEVLNFDKHLPSHEITKMIGQIWWEAQGTNFPQAVVMDFGLLPNGEWALIEFNEAWCSGLYYCDYEECLRVVQQSQRRR